jgi:hypothetical protein
MTLCIQQVSRDNTLDSPTGHYMYFTNTDQGPQRRARMLTNYINTTGICLRLFYRFIGNKLKEESSTLAVRITFIFLNILLYGTDILISTVYIYIYIYIY